MEANDIYIDLMRIMIEKYAELHKECYLGQINFHGSQREAFLEGKISCYEKYVGQTIYNYSYSFIVPIKDTHLEKLIHVWNSKCPMKLEVVNNILNRIEELDGNYFIWR